MSDREIDAGIAWYQVKSYHTKPRKVGVKARANEDRYDWGKSHKYFATFAEAEQYIHQRFIDAVARAEKELKNATRRLANYEKKRAAQQGKE